MDQLKFAKENSKINALAKALNLPRSRVVSFDLPAGYTCPAGKSCKAYCNPKTGKLQRGKDCQFTCFAAKIECAFPNSRHAHWSNFRVVQSILKSEGAVGLSKLLIAAIKQNKIKVIRIHSSGDFYCQAYYEAWKLTAMALPEVQFFGYSKMLAYVKDQRPENFKLVYSHGSKFDSIADNVPTCYVIMNDEHIMPIACKQSPADDYDYILRQESFGIMLH